MRKFAIFMIAMSLLLLGLSCSRALDDNAQPVRATVLQQASDPMEEWSRTEFLGHTYIVWSGLYAGGIAHDPDCACGKGKP